MQSHFSSTDKQCLHESFEDRVREDPDKTAIIYDGASLSYLELNHRVNQVSNHLLESGVEPGSFIGFLTKRSLEMVIGYMAILKAGCVVVPLDTENPEERQNLILEDANIKGLLTQTCFTEQYKQADFSIIPIDLSDPLIGQASVNNPELDIDIDQVALIVYTSGSTGLPKGVMISHANLAHYVDVLPKYFNLTGKDTYLHRGAISLITSVRQLFAPLAIGSTVVITTSEQTLDPLKLFKLVKDYSVTIMDHVPSFWLMLKKVTSTLNDREKLSLFDTKLRLIAAGGEVVAVDVAKFWFDHFGDGVEFYNIYGQTEGTGVVTFYKITKSELLQSSNISIGGAVDNMQLHILNLQLQPVTDDEAGEICISGKGVSLGYLNKADLTDEKFISIPSKCSDLRPVKLYKTGDLGRYRQDGTVELLGRIDDQVHIKGRRIELNEIQMALSSHPLIDVGQVIVDDVHDGGQILLAFLVPVTDQIPEPDGIRKFLLERIPGYMVPSKYIILEAFPLSPSGKIDRQRLSSAEYTHLQHEQNCYYPPVNDLQKILVETWESTLQIKGIGIRDDFFNLGGDSLKGVHLICAMERSLGYELPVETLYQISTIERMAKAIQLSEKSSDYSGSMSLTKYEYKTMLTILTCCGIPRVNRQSLLLKMNEKGTLPPLFWCFNAPGSEMAALAKFLPEDQPLYGLLSSAPLENTQSTLESVAAHYLDEMLKLYPEGPFILGGNCRGAKVMCEIHNLLQDRQVRVDKVCLLEFFHPSLYDFDGELMLLFGKYSHFKRHELLNWKKKGWLEPFKKTPEVYWIYCEHGQFFNKKNIRAFSGRVRQFLYGVEMSTLPKIVGDLLRGGFKMLRGKC